MPKSDALKKRVAAYLPRQTWTAEETMAVGDILGRLLIPGSVLALYGELGSGKTHLVKGIARALGIAPEEVSSPTFTLIHEYAGAQMPLYHMDLYRLKHPEEFSELGYEEYFYGPGITVIEWPERVEDFLPPHTLRLELVHCGGDCRLIRLKE